METAVVLVNDRVEPAQKLTSANSHNRAKPSSPHLAESPDTSHDGSVGGTKFGVTKDTQAEDQDTMETYLHIPEEIKNRNELPNRGICGNMIVHLFSETMTPAIKNLYLDSKELELLNDQCDKIDHCRKVMFEDPTLDLTVYYSIAMSMYRKGQETEFCPLCLKLKKDRVKNEKDEQPKSHIFPRCLLEEYRQIHCEDHLKEFIYCQISQKYKTSNNLTCKIFCQTCESNASKEENLLCQWYLRINGMQDNAETETSRSDCKDSEALASTRTHQSTTVGIQGGMKTGTQQSTTETQESKTGTQESTAETQESTTGTQESTTKTQESTTGTQESTTEIQESKTGTQESITETRESTTGTQESTTETQESKTGTQESITETRESTTGTQESTTETQESKTGTQESITETRESTTGTQESTTDIQESTTGTQESTTENQECMTGTPKSTASAIQENVVTTENTLQMPQRDALMLKHVLAVILFRCMLLGVTIVKNFENEFWSKFETLREFCSTTDIEDYKNKPLLSDFLVFVLANKTYNEKNSKSSYQVDFQLRNPQLTRMVKIDDDVFLCNKFDSFHCMLLIKPSNSIKNFDPKKFFHEFPDFLWKYNLSQIGSLCQFSVGRDRPCRIFIQDPLLQIAMTKQHPSLPPPLSVNINVNSDDNSKNELDNDNKKKALRRIARRRSPLAMVDGETHQEFLSFKNEYEKLRASYTKLQKSSTTKAKKHKEDVQRLNDKMTKFDRQIKLVYSKFQIISTLGEKIEVLEDEERNLREQIFYQKSHNELNPYSINNTDWDSPCDTSIETV